MEFLDAKRKKERGQTNAEFFEWVKSQELDFEEIAIVVRQPNGRIVTYWSQEESLSLVGTLEVAKRQIMDDMQD